MGNNPLCEIVDTHGMQCANQCLIECIYMYIYICIFILAYYYTLIGILVNTNIYIIGIACEVMSHGLVNYVIISIESMFWWRNTILSISSLLLFDTTATSRIQTISFVISSIRDVTYTYHYVITHYYMHDVTCSSPSCHLRCHLLCLCWILQPRVYFPVFLSQCCNVKLFGRIS